MLSCARVDYASLVLQSDLGRCVDGRWQRLRTWKPRIASVERAMARTRAAARVLRRVTRVPPQVFDGRYCTL